MTLMQADSRRLHDRRPAQLLREPGYATPPTALARRQLLLAATVALHDIDDIESFVNGTINQFCQGRPGRAGVNLTAHEREELVAEGLAILYRLAAVYQPNPNHERDDSRFSGFAAAYLPKKLGDAWHRMHEEHRLITDPETGKRRWVYYDKHTSFDAVVCQEDSDSSFGHSSRVHEGDVRFLRDFAPIPVPAGTGSSDASAPDGAAARAA